MASNGAGKVVRKEKNDKSMEKMGTAVQKRREAHDSLKVTVSQKGDKLAIRVSQERNIQVETAWNKGSKRVASLESMRHKRVDSVLLPAIKD